MAQPRQPPKTHSVQGGRRGHAARYLRQPSGRGPARWLAACAPAPPWRGGPARPRGRAGRKARRRRRRARRRRRGRRARRVSPLPTPPQLSERAPRPKGRLRSSKAPAGRVKASGLSRTLPARRSIDTGDGKGTPTERSSAGFKATAGGIKAPGLSDEPNFLMYQSELCN